MITTLNIIIDGTNFSALFYAGDVLLTSLTVCGLQKVINFTNQYITAHGFKFNPQKPSVSLCEDVSYANSLLLL